MITVKHKAKEIKQQALNMISSILILTAKIQVDCNGAFTISECLF
jgi:hypothetical protein